MKFDNKKPPFVLDNASNLPKATTLVGNMFVAMEKENDPNNLGGAVEAVIISLGLGADDPYAKSLNDLSERIINNDRFGDDGHSYSGEGNAYHNTQHMAETMLNVCFLMAVNDASNLPVKLETEDKAKLVLAALAHDIGHDGTGNGMGDKRQPYRLEKRSADALDPIIAKHFGANAAEVSADIRTMIYTTDIGGGENAPSTYLKALCNGQEPSSHHPSLQEISRLNGNRKLAEMSAILCDADIFTAIGLGLKAAWWQNKRVEREFAKLAGKEAPEDFRRSDKNGLLFFQNSLADLKSNAGKLFTPVFENIKLKTAKIIDNFKER